MKSCAYWENLAMLKPFLILTCALSMLSPTAYALDAGSASDLTVGVATVGSIAAMPTWDKRGNALVVHAASAALNYGLKKIFRQGRPDEPDSTEGMPSGHSQQAMTGAGIVCQEYGGLPCAGGVGLGLSTMLLRVKAGRHSPAQVLVGGSIGFGAGFWGANAIVVF